MPGTKQVRSSSPLSEAIFSAGGLTKDAKKTKLEFHYLGYYLRWIPQENYYYSVKHADFQARPYRTQGTYTKYISLDDKIEDLNYYTTYIKFGIGRATSDSTQ